MKKSRKVIVILLLALLLVAAITVAACTPTPHEHTYSSQWSYDETEHWHSATCKHDVTADRAAHDYGTDDVCDTCGYIKGQGGSDNPTHQHSFAEQWSSNEIEHWHAATCNHDVTADNAAHTFVNNVCSVCGYQNNVNWDDFVFEPCDGGYMLTKYNGTAAHVNIPNTYNDLPVVRIENSAFSPCENLISVTIPDNVTSIGDDAFYDCENLATVNIGASSKLESIGEYAFCGCYSLTSITIPDSVTSIREFCFASCDSLISITIPNSVTSISIGTFVACSSLTSIAIPDNVTSIGDRAFDSCSSLASIVIPNSVTYIGDNAFVDCRSLTSITIPKSVTIIGSRAFGNCNSFKSIIIPDSVTSIDYYAFDNCYSLVIYCETLDRPSGWSIGWNFSSMKSFCCPVVWNCKQNNIADDGYVYDIVDGICYGFKDSQAKVYGNNYLGDVTIPSTVNYQGKDYLVTIIGDCSFCDCDSLASITIPDSVTIIGYGAFYNCFNLTSITIPDSVSGIGERAFCGCKNLTSITIPDSVTSIGSLAFAGCSSLTSIFIPKSVTDMGSNHVFLACNNLTIYCEVSEKPSDWRLDWNYLDFDWHQGNCPVVWGATRQDAEQH